LDNLVSYHLELSNLSRQEQGARPGMLDYYFDVFLQQELKVSTADYLKEIELYNQPLDEDTQDRDEWFFRELKKSHPEFEATYAKYLAEREAPDRDLMQYIMHHSEFLQN
jgi:stage V sporulation protein R